MPSGFQTTAQLQAWLDTPGRSGKILHGVTPPARPRPQGQALAPILTLIQDLAAAHGWAGEDHVTYNDEGDDQGLHVTLIRDEVILFAEVQAVKGARSLRQRHWLEKLRATGHCEVYEWDAEDAQAIQERLSRKRELP